MMLEAEQHLGAEQIFKVAAARAVGSRMLCECLSELYSMLTERLQQLAT